MYKDQERLTLCLQTNWLCEICEIWEIEQHQLVRYRLCQFIKREVMEKEKMISCWRSYGKGTIFDRSGVGEDDYAFYSRFYQFIKISSSSGPRHRWTLVGYVRLMFARAASCWFSIPSERLAGMFCSWQVVFYSHSSIHIVPESHRSIFGEIVLSSIIE